MSLPGTMLAILLFLIALSNFSNLTEGYCVRNEDCGHPHLCCSITPALGKRQVDADFNVHYCLPYKNKNATWCSLNIQFAAEKPNYHGLCPCAPGLQCVPTDELDPKWYPRDRYGKCRPLD